MDNAKNQKNVLIISPKCMRTNIEIQTWKVKNDNEIQHYIFELDKNQLSYIICPKHSATDVTWLALHFVHPWPHLVRRQYKSNKGTASEVTVILNYWEHYNFFSQNGGHFVIYSKMANQRGGLLSKLFLVLGESSSEFGIWLLIAILED